MAQSNYDYQDKLKKATDLATRATQAEASLSSLSPLASPLPTLHKAFPLYISAAEQYSLILSTQTLSDDARTSLKRKWRLVLERAEKVKRRIEDLGGHVGKAVAGDEVEEESVKARGAIMNGVRLDPWSAPHSSLFRGEKVTESQPELAREQEELNPEWAEVEDRAWETKMNNQRWLVRQGPGADCSVVAGIGACLDHNRRFGTTLAHDAMWPVGDRKAPVRSDNGRHVIKLLLNGCWRGVVIDSLLPRTRFSHRPLHATSYSAGTAARSEQPSIGSPWIPLLLKGYFKAHGGYSLRGSNPAPDVYTLTGWIPERISLRDGFQREKEWRRIKQAWDRGDLIVTLGTGSRESSGEGLVPYHAYAVLDIEEDERGERSLTVYDPGIMRQHVDGTDLADRMQSLDIDGQGMTGTGLFTRSWDAICAEFETLNLNWNPALMPITVKRHWSWSKPSDDDSGAVSSLRYRLNISSRTLQPRSEIWVMLSQHIVNKDRALDDIALHVHEESAGVGGGSSKTTVSALERIASSSPYSNAVHVLYRHVLRKASTSLTIIPMRDRGLYRTDFTLQAFAPDNLTIDLERISTTLPFSATVSGQLTSRNAGGHAGLPSWIDNPQYKLVVGSAQGRRAAGAIDSLRVMLQGDAEMAWNVKVLWGKGELVFEWDDDGSLGDSGAYAYGMALADITSIQPGTYTLPVSAFEAKQHGRYTLTVESTLPVSLSAIPAEGAGMYSRVVSGVWTSETAGGRPSGGSYDMNPRIEVTLPRDCTIMARAIHPNPSQTPLPLNLTLFNRAPGSHIAEQRSTSGPYSDSVCGVSLPRTKVPKGVYVFVISAWERGLGVGRGWEVRVWGDAGLEVELVR